MVFSSACRPKAVAPSLTAGVPRVANGLPLNIKGPVSGLLVSPHSAGQSNHWVHTGRFYGGPQNADVIAVAFKKQNRILKRSEFLKISEVGKRCHSRLFILLYVARPQACSRLGLIVTKKVGSAVQRNRIKRLCREYFRHHRHRWSQPFDIVLIARRGAARATNAEIRLSLEKNFHQLPR